MIGGLGFSVKTPIFGFSNEKSDAVALAKQQVERAKIMAKGKWMAARINARGEAETASTARSFIVPTIAVLAAGVAIVAVIRAVSSKKTEGAR